MAQLHPATVIYVRRGVTDLYAQSQPGALCLDHADPALILCFGLCTVSGLMDGNPPFLWS